jgi:hypothetical protein
MLAAMGRFSLELIRAESKARYRQVRDLPLLHGRYRLKSLTLTALLGNTFEYLEHAQRRDHQAFNILNRYLEESGVRAVSEVLQPTRAIDNVHARSSSRST